MGDAESIPAAPYACPTAYFEYLGNLEKVERDERRGLETRATTLLAAAITTLGFVAVAVRGADLEGFGPTARYIGAAIGTCITLGLIVAVAQLFRALRTKGARTGARPDRRDSLDTWIKHQSEKITAIENGNHDMLRNLSFAGTVLAFVLLSLLAGIIWLISAGPGS